MKRNAELLELQCNSHSHSRKVEGVPALLWKEAVTQDELSAGDKVKIFSLPDGKTFISKVDSSSEGAYTVGRITPAHIYFDDDMAIKEV